MPTLRIDGVLGKAAIYTNGSTAPLTNPLGNMSRVKFHSDFDYIAIVRTVTGTLNLPARAGGALGDNDAETFNGPLHLQTGIPLVEGFIRIAGNEIAFAGSVPVYYNDTNGYRQVSLGADSTRILFHDYYTVAYNNRTLPAISLPYEVYITDERLA